MLEHQVRQLTEAQEAVFRKVQCNHELIADSGCDYALYVEVEIEHSYKFEGYLCIAKIQGMCPQDECYVLER